MADIVDECQQRRHRAKAARDRAPDIAIRTQSVKMPRRRAQHRHVRASKSVDRLLPVSDDKDGRLERTCIRKSGTLTPGLNEQRHQPPLGSARVLEFVNEHVVITGLKPVSTLREDLKKHGKMTQKQWLVAGIALLMIIAWITDKDLIEPILGFPLGLGGVAMTGTVLFMLLGLTSWSDYEKNVSWGVIVLYAGAISLGAVFKSSGAAKWLADSLISILTTFNIESGLPLAILVAIIGALMTNLMSAGATVAVIGPVVLEMAVSSGTNPIIIGVALAIATSMAFWLVIGTPASSVVYSAGLLDAKDFIRMATFAWPAAMVIIIVMIIFYWVGLGIQPIMIGG